MANNDASSASLNNTIRVLVSFFLAAGDEASSSRSTVAIHKEKFNVPLKRRTQRALQILEGLKKPSLG